MQEVPPSEWVHPRHAQCWYVVMPVYCIITLAAVNLIVRATVRARDSL